jgi:hypothetical protein
MPARSTDHELKVVAMFRHRAAIAKGLRAADAAAVQDQVSDVRSNASPATHELLFNDDCIIGLGDADAFGPQHVTVDRQAGNPGRGRERRSPSYGQPGKLGERLHRRRHFAVVAGDGAWAM